MPSAKAPLKILLVGGGTGGPVAPLLAVAQCLRNARSRVEFLFIGTRKGPEQAMVAAANIAFTSIFAGKWRRYFSVKNLLTPFQVIIGFVQALLVLKKNRPVVAFGAGGFVQVPVLYAAWIYRIPVIIHQQDISPGFANAICAPIASLITVSFEESLKEFSQGTGLLSHKSKSKVIVTGNPC